MARQQQETNEERRDLQAKQGGRNTRKIERMYKQQPSYEHSMKKNRMNGKKATRGKNGAQRKKKERTRQELTSALVVGVRRIDSNICNNSNPISHR